MWIETRPEVATKESFAEARHADQTLGDFNAKHTLNYSSKQYL